MRISESSESVTLEFDTSKYEWISGILVTAFSVAFFSFYVLKLSSDGWDLTLATVGSDSGSTFTPIWSAVWNLFFLILSILLVIAGVLGLWSYGFSPQRRVTIDRAVHGKITDLTRRRLFGDRRHIWNRSAVTSLEIKWLSESDPELFVVIGDERVSVEQTSNKKLQSLADQLGELLNVEVKKLY